MVTALLRLSPKFSFYSSAQGVVSLVSAAAAKAVCGSCFGGHLGESLDLRCFSAPT